LIPMKHFLDPRKDFAPGSPPPPKPRAKHFLGFEVNSSPKLRELWQRLKVLEKWNELAIGPKSFEDCHPEDRFLLPPKSNSNHVGVGVGVGKNDRDGDGFVDGLPALRKQWRHVRNLLNAHISTLAVETTPWEPDLVVRPSQIPNAGMGLYYCYPPTCTRTRTRNGEQYEIDNGVAAVGDLDVTATPIPKGTLICHYTGHVHTHSSSRELPIEDRSYLMWIRGNTLVDPGPLPNITARYINDPLNEQLVNCRYVPTNNITTTSGTTRSSCVVLGKCSKSEDEDDPHEDTIRTSVYTTRTIWPGEELFARYGDVYWDQQPISGTTLASTLNGGASNTNESEISERTVDNSFSIHSNEEPSNDGGGGDDDHDGENNDDDGDNDIDTTFPFSHLFDPKRIRESLLLDT